MDISQRLADALGVDVDGVYPLSGGCVAQVMRADLRDGSSLVVKQGGNTYEIEAAMLRALRERSALPVPEVVWAEPDLLVIAHVEHDNSGGPEAETHAADLLADLHSVHADQFGFDHDTLIGSLDQPCAWTPSWVEFFAAHRLRRFGVIAHERGGIDLACRDRIERLADRVGEFIDEPDRPCLVHGDVWRGNVLTRNCRIAAFIDPAVHYAHPEVELAFITLFGTLGSAFFARYHERMPIRAGFFETRRHVYNLYPLLVHASLFGGGYGTQVHRSLDLLGC